MGTAGSLRSAVHHHVAVFVFDSEAPGGVARLLPAVVVHSLDGAVGVLPPLVVGRVDLPLARVEVDLLGAVPGRAFQAEAGWRSEGLNEPLYSRVDLYDRPVRQHALLPAAGEQVLHRLVWERDFLTAVWEMFFWSRRGKAVFPVCISRRSSAHLPVWLLGKCRTSMPSG